MRAVHVPHSSVPGFDGATRDAVIQRLTEAEAGQIPGQHAYRRRTLGPRRAPCNLFRQPAAAANGRRRPQLVRGPQGRARGLRRDQPERAAHRGWGGGRGGHPRHLRAAGRGDRAGAAACRSGAGALRTAAGGVAAAGGPRSAGGRGRLRFQQPAEHHRRLRCLRRGAGDRPYRQGPAAAAPCLPISNRCSSQGTPASC